MCTSKPKAPKAQPLPPPPPPLPEATPTAPVIDPMAKDRLALRPRRRGLADLRIPLGAPTGLNIPQG